MSRDGKIKRRNTELYGLALIIVAVLALAGLLLEPVLGQFGKAVKGFVTGVFGLSAYALFTALLAVGVALFKNYTIAVSPKRLICVVGMFVLALLILHTVSSVRLINSETPSFSDYIYRCYQSGITFGGIAMGVIVYPLVLSITALGAYIIFGLMFLVLLLGFMDFRVFSRRRATPKVVQTAAKSKPPQNSAPPAPSKKLAMPFFTIQNKDNVSVSEGVASNIPSNAVNTQSPQIETLRTYYYGNNTGKPADTSYTPAAQQSATDGYKPYNAHLKGTSGQNRFFADSATYNRPADKPSGGVTGFEVSGQNSYISPGGNQYARPPKIIHDDNSAARKNYPQPKIINAEERSRQLAEQKRQSEQAAEQAAEQARAQESPQPSHYEKPRQYVMPKIIDADEMSNKLREGKQNPDKSDNLNKFKEMLKNSYNLPESYDNAQAAAAGAANTGREQSGYSEEYSQYNTDKTVKDGAEGKTPPASSAAQDILPPKITAQPSMSGQAPEDDYTGYYKVVKPSEQKSDLEQKIGALEGIKLPKKTKVNENQIPIEDYIQQTAKPVKAPRRRSTAKYVLPPIDLLQDDSTYTGSIDAQAHDKAAQLEQVLEEFKTPAKVIGITKGPAVTRYELQMPPGVSVRKISDKAEDIAYTMAASAGIRIETPIPGKQAVGIEIPNEIIDKVSLREIIESKEFAKMESPLSFALGKDITGQTIVCDLLKMPHLLVAGATNSGKSSCLNSLITSMLYRSSPEDLRFILIDPKRVEFVSYKGLPHLLLKNPITEPEVALKAFEWAIEESENRFQMFAAAKVRDIKEYNSSKQVMTGEAEKLPYIVIVVDELADLMLQSKRDFEDRIRAIAQKSRAAGLHLVIATQRPSVDIITGTIKANLPSRIAFSVTSFADSKTILDQGGAEKLLGRGDMLYAPVDRNEPIRVQGAYVTNDDVLDVVNYVKENNESYFDHEIEERIYKVDEEPDEEITSAALSADDADPNLPQILKMFMDYGQASATLIQRRFRYGYAKAARIMDQLELKKFITPFDGTNKPRKVLITTEQYEEIYGDTDEE